MAEAKIVWTDYMKYRLKLRSYDFRRLSTFCDTPPSGMWTRHLGVWWRLGVMVNFWS